MTNTSHPRGSPFSDVRSMFKDELTLPTGSCFACPRTGEHLCEHLLDDAEDLLDLDPVWHLDGDC